MANLASTSRGPLRTRPISVGAAPPSTLKHQNFCVPKHTHTAAHISVPSGHEPRKHKRLERRKTKTIQNSGPIPHFTAFSTHVQTIYCTPQIYIAITPPPHPHTHTHTLPSPPHTPPPRVVSVACPHPTDVTIAARVLTESTELQEEEDKSQAIWSQSIATTHTPQTTTLVSASACVRACVCRRVRVAVQVTESECYGGKTNPL